MNFNFQGSQILAVRVPISQKASEVDFQFPARIISFMMVHNAVVSNFLGIFSGLLYFWRDL